MPENRDNRKIYRLYGEALKNYIPDLKQQRRFHCLSPLSMYKRYRHAFICVNKSTPCFFTSKYPSSYRCSGCVSSIDSKIRAWLQTTTDEGRQRRSQLFWELNNLNGTKYVCLLSKAKLSTWTVSQVIQFGK